MEIYGDPAVYLRHRYPRASFIYSITKPFSVMTPFPAVDILQLRRSIFVRRLNALLFSLSGFADSMTADAETKIMAISANGPTPEQRDEINRVVNLFDLDWTIDVKTEQIKRKPRSILQRLRDIFWPRRHTVFALYWWLKNEYHRRDRTNLMAFTFPINHDNMPISGYPMKYEIVGDWSIPKKDLRFLIKGPLARISPEELLVPHQIGYERIKSFVKAWWPIVAFLSALLTILLRVFQLEALL